jgi:hypothetical protein
MVLADLALRSPTTGNGDGSFLFTSAHNQPVMTINGTLTEDQMFSLLNSMFSPLADSDQYRSCA